MEYTDERFYSIRDKDGARAVFDALKNNIAMYGSEVTMNFGKQGLAYVQEFRKKGIVVEVSVFKFNSEVFRSGTRTVSLYTLPEYLDSDFVLKKTQLACVNKDDAHSYINDAKTLTYKERTNKRKGSKFVISQNKLEAKVCAMKILSKNGAMTSLELKRRLKDEGFDEFATKSLPSSLARTGHIKYSKGSGVCVPIKERY